VYSPVTVVFDWTGDPDSSAQFLVYSKKYPTTKYISIIFKGTEAAIVVNGDTQSVPFISSFFTDDRNIRKVSLDIYTQNTTKNIDTSASITGRLQIVLTDFQTGINRVLWDNVINADPSDLYQFEARLIHS
jgi:hypothetical protein